MWENFPSTDGTSKLQAVAADRGYASFQAELALKQVGERIHKFGEATIDDDQAIQLQL